jgi:U4/U6 small nuclear ribonucleoprotein PRP3
MKRSTSEEDDDTTTGTVTSSSSSSTYHRQEKRLKGIEIHPLLSASSTGSLVTRTDALSLQQTAPKKENPYLSHLKQNKRPDRLAFLDKRLPTEPSIHRPRQLKFKAAGQCSLEAERQRQAALERQLQREIAQLTAEAELVDAGIVADLLKKEDEENSSSAIDHVEWWDAPFLTPNKALNFDMLGNLIQRPSLHFLASKSTKSTPAAAAAEALNIYLTKEERKKLRRQRRLETQREEQEKIALGLLPAPPPKVKLSSLPRMLAQPGNQLGNESVSDPTRLAAEIKAQSEARAAAHQEANQNRALTPEERAAKKYRKLAELDAGVVHVACFKIHDRFEDGAVRFKVLMNAEQFHLRGRLLVGPEFSLLIAEGGPKGIRRFCHLLQERMLKQTFAGWAQLLWRGEQVEFDAFDDGDAFGKKPFVMLSFDNEFDVNEAAKAAGIQSYWTLAKSTK